MKKFISIMLSAALCVLNANGTVFAEETPVKSVVSVGSTAGEVGETVSVPISIDDNQGIISLVTEITYDTTAIKLIGVNKDAEFWQSANMTPGGDVTAQPYRIIWYDGLAKSDFTDNGTLAELSFEILKEGSHEIDVTISEPDTFNSDFVSVPIEVKSGVIDVHSESVTTTEVTATSTTAVTTTTSETTETATTTTTESTTEAETTTSTTTTENNDTIGKLIINDQVGKVGETLNIPISIQNNPGIISLVAEISYDNTALKLLGANKNADFWNDVNMTPGGDLTAQPYRIIWYDGLAKSDFTEDGVLAELSFEVLKEGSHEVKITISDSDTFNTEFVSVPFETSAGIVEVSSESTTTEPETPTNIGSDEELCEWAINDYEQKTGITAAKAEITSKGDTYEITLTDDEGNVLDVYTIDPLTGVGTDTEGETVDLPQTGNNSMKNWLIVFGALMLIGLGVVSVKASRVSFRRKDEQ